MRGRLPFSCPNINVTTPEPHGYEGNEHRAIHGDDGDESTPIRMRVHFPMGEQEEDDTDEGQTTNENQYMEMGDKRGERKGEGRRREIPCTTRES